MARALTATRGASLVIIFSGLPADVLLGKLKKDISFALRRGTIAQVTTALDAGQRAAEAELRADTRS